MTQFYDPQGTLIDWKDGAGWSLTDALAGTLVTGAIGSGKSSGPGSMLRKAFLRSTTALKGGMGGMAFFAKNGECDEWVRECQQLGRGGDVIRVTPGGRYACNMLDWLAQWGATPAGGSGDGAVRGPIPIVSFLEEVATAVAPEKGKDTGENAFFESAHRTKLTNLVLACQLAGLPVSLGLMRAISSSVPQTAAQAEDPAWRRKSVCWQVLREAEARTKGNPAASKDFEECRNYYIVDYPALSFKTRGTIDIMFTNLVSPFLTRPLRPLLCEETNITVELMFKGAIFLIDIPVQEYHQTAKLAALAFKRMAQLAIMRRAGPPGALRPVFLFADEAQNFLSPKDTDYQAVARSAGGVTCFLTQQVSSIREALGSPDKAENLISNLQTKFFCQNSGETAHYASKLIGERYTQITGINIGHSASRDPQAQGAGGTTGGVNRSEQKRAYIEASAFQQLRRGGKGNSLIVDAVVFAGGKMFAGDKEQIPFKILSFRQE